MGKNNLSREKMITRKLNDARDALSQMLPFANLGMAVATECDAISLEDFTMLARASGVSITYDRLIRWLCDQGYFAEVGDLCGPQFAHIESDLFEVANGAVETILGQMLTMTSLVTGKGQVVLLDALRHEFGTTTKDEEDTIHG